MIALIVTADTLTQRQAEAFARAYRDAPAGRSRIEERGVTVRAAAAAGWFGGALTAEGVDDLSARAVNDLAEAVNALYKEAIAPDPKA